MANEKEDVIQASAGAPGANIPDLKKKEKERKRAGAAWSGARGAAGEFTGATGGTVARAAASAAGMAAEGAMVGAEGLEGGSLWAMLSRFLAGLTSTLLGKMAVAAAAFLLVAGAGLLGYEMMKGKGDAAMGSPELGGISDSMRVRAGGDDRLGVAGRGEIAFDPQSASNPPAAAAPAAAKAEDAKPAPDAKAAEAEAEKPVASGQLAHNLSGTKLSSSMGGDFGSKNIFSGNSAAPKFGAAATNLSKFAGAKGQLSASKASTLRGTASARNVNRSSSNRALGQAMFAKGLGLQAVHANSAEGASSAAQNAFDQQQTAGGALNTVGAPGGDTPPALGGGGAPDTTLPNAPGNPGGSTPIDSGLQNSLSQISSLANQAMSNIQTGTIMMVLGAILIGIGAAMGLWGIPLIVAGAALVAMGLMKISTGKAEAKQAIAMGQQLGQDIGNVQQANAINYCTNNAVTTGTPVESCTPPDSVTNYTNQDAQNTIDVKKVNDIPASVKIKP